MQSSLELDMVFHSVTDMIHDAASVVMDSTECSLVRRQAAILISNLIAGVYNYYTHHSDAAGKVCSLLATQ